MAQTALNAPLKTPYTDKTDASDYVSHADTSPYIPDKAEKDADEPSLSPYTSPESATEEADPDTFKSPYTTPEVGNDSDK